MFKRYFLFQKNNGLSPYIWTVLCILPFYFIGQSSSTIGISLGILGTLLFFVLFRIAFITKDWSIYIWTFLLISISTAWIILYKYVYLAFFLAYLVGNIRGKVTFYIMYVTLLVTTAVAINVNFITQDVTFLKQLPFVIVTYLSIVLLPFNMRNRNKMDKLEEKLEDANKRIAELVKIEERERIARDLHDTLGQRLSLIGLKSDLARRVMVKDPERANQELKDVQQTARTALNEVRKMVSSMRVIRLNEEIKMIQEVLQVAGISYHGIEEAKLTKVDLLTENILSMCLKEGITNVVKHSDATACEVSINESDRDVQLIIKDNGTFKNGKGHGLVGMRERLEFVNGGLDVHTKNGTELRIRVPKDVKQVERGNAG